FAFLADEESGGVWGAGWLVENRPDLLPGVTEALSEVGGFSVPLAADPADDRRAYLVATSEKGVAWSTLRARGHAAHGSRPTDDNSVVRLAQAVAAVGAHRFPVVRTPALQRFLDVFGEARGLAFTDESLAADLDSLGFVASLVGATTRNTATPTVLSAGDKTNIIPAEASARLDIRVLPGQDDALRAGLREVVGDGIDIREGRWWSATEAPVDAAIIGILQQAISLEDAEGVVVPYLLPASTDNKHFARLGINGYGFVPLRVPREFDVFAQFHAADERVPVDALLFSARVTARILQSA
ncbi:MAG: M20/M25/M40 family metallo-hydrolase, partial [Microbacterium sp.]|uniref:M20/M25/M40 family metallo-hydrolase n=1 Tax=Microbacterium sp. TaxID=51671 RepID=UPI003F7E2AC3